MWVCMGKVSMRFDVPSERFFLVHRSSFGHLKAVLHHTLSDKQVLNLANGTDLRGVQDLLDFFEHVRATDLISGR